MSMSLVASKPLDFHVIKDLAKQSDTTEYLEPLNIFSHKWRYRGEGNANVVVSLQDDQRVVRLSKVNVGEAVSDLKRHRRKVEREVIFANQIFGPLIGPEFVGSVKAIQLSPEQISLLNDKLQKYRPHYRLHKEIRVPYATSHNDFARIHRSSSMDFCIEIKPKQGWWPNYIKSCSGNSPNLCTYCLNQFLKLKRGKISSRTSYCPLDLFSGDPQRMIEAITSLVANPQNNFRIFSDGQLVYGESNDESLEMVLNQWLGCNGTSNSLHTTDQPSTLNSFIYLLCAALLKPKHIPGKKGGETFNVITRQLRTSLCLTPPSHLYTKIMSKSSHAISPGDDKNLEKGNLGMSCNDESSPLPEGSILSRILAIQKLAEVGTNGLSRNPSIYKIYQKICPVHSASRRESSFPSSNGLDDEPRLDVVLTGDSYEHLQLVERNEIERLSDADSFEGGSSTEEEEDTITCGVKYHDAPRTQDSFSFLDCPSPACLNVEQWLDEIEDLPLTPGETMAMEMYLLAATAKDCSIMLTFSPTNNNELPQETKFSGCFYKDTDLFIEDLNKKTHRVRIGVADLDPKPVTTVVRHYLRDNEMLEAYDTHCRV